jgi:uncharacterized LabA/DUF88 family protein
VYIDGFNLYYGAVKGTEYKWLDLEKMITTLLGQQHELVQIKYFSAIVSGRSRGDRSPINQQIYLRALESNPLIEVHLGHFLTHTVPMRLADNSRTVLVKKTEEKGSDVNLATHMLVDGFRDKYDCAVMITNDSDLAEPFRVVRDELNKRVGVICPHKRVSQQLAKYAQFTKKIRAGLLSVSQLPDQVHDAKGVINKPPNW